MPKVQQKQKGFVLIVALVLLVAVTLLVVNGMGLSTISERMSGNHMDRGRANLAAEQAITQGLALLQGEGDTCLNSGCTNINLAGTAAKHAATVAPSTWSDINAGPANFPDGQKWKYLINWLSDVTFTPVGSAKADCKAYSIMGRGEGLSSQSVVILQTIAYICPTD
jgi:type IV pilus assembly protein PilX